MLTCLEALVDQSLIVRQPGPDAPGPRFTMLETIREFGLTCLHASNEQADTRDRHAAYFRDLVVALDLFYAFPGDESWLASVAPEEANLRQALEWFLSRGDIRSLGALSSALAPFWITRSQSLEGLRWLERAIAADADVSLTVGAQCREAAGLFLLQHGDVAAAAPLIDEAVALARARGDLRLLRHTLQTQGHLALAQGDFARAMALHVESEHAARAVAPGTRNGGLYIGAQLCMQGLVAHRGGDTATALARLSAGIPYLQAPGGQRRLGMILGELGIIQITVGQVPDAAQNLIQSVAMTWQAGYEAALVRSLRGVGVIAATTGQPVAGAYLLGAAAAINTGMPFLAVRTAPDHDITESALAALASHLEPGDLERGQRLGAELGTEQAIALACEVIGQIVGEDRVQEIWRETHAPDPGPAPGLSRLALSPVQELTIAEHQLTSREQEILVLLCQRWTDAEIAAHFFISPRTVNHHVSNILAKLGASNRREAAAIAVRSGLFPARKSG
jgi:non-specific serine/threonine protein kinase